MVVELAPDEFSSLIRQMNQVMDNMMGRQYFGFSPTDAFRPAVNLYETEQSFLVCVDLAGMYLKDIDVQVDKSQLIIRGTRTSPVAPEGAKALAVHLMEIDHGSFCRTVEIPASVNEKQITAAYADGLLWVTLPKK